jgi:deoxyribose-phosphate aldolase
MEPDGPRKLTAQNLAEMVDLSAVRADVAENELKSLAESAIRYHCKCVYVMPCYIPLIRELLPSDSGVYVGGTVGFPSGADTTRIKVEQAKMRVKEGCDELDMVINVGMLKSKRYSYVKEDIRAVTAEAQGKPVKVILEVTYLNRDEIKKGCELSISCGAQFVKTGTGWAPEPTTIEHVRLIKSFVGDAIKIKVAGGVRDLKTLIAMHKLGATRFGIGLSSGIKIFEECAAFPNGIVEI